MSRFTNEAVSPRSIPEIHDLQRIIKICIVRSEAELARINVHFLFICVPCRIHVCAMTRA